MLRRSFLQSLAALMTWPLWPLHSKPTANPIGPQCGQLIFNRVVQLENGGTVKIANLIPNYDIPRGSLVYCVPHTDPDDREVTMAAIMASCEPMPIKISDGRVSALRRVNG